MIKEWEEERQEEHKIMFSQDVRKPKERRDMKEHRKIDRGGENHQRLEEG